MDNVAAALAIVALLLGLIEEVQAQGKSLVGWGVVALALSVLWPFFT